jgi:hypothetical protein
MLPSCGSGAAVLCAIAGSAVVTQIKSSHFHDIIAFLTPWRKCKENAKPLAL